MTKNENDFKELEHRVDVLSNLHAKESFDIDYTLSDLQSRVRKLEEIKQSSSDDSSDKNFWRNCLGILCVSIVIIFMIELAVIVILSKIGLC